MSRAIYIYGGGGHGKVILDTLRAQFGNEAISGVFDDDPQKKNLFFYGSKIIGSINDYPGAVPELIIAIGDNLIRRQKAQLLNSKVTKFITAIHPSSIIAPSAVIGPGTVIMPGVIINADVKIGNHCIVNSGAIIEHDCVIGDYTHIAPGSVLAGGVEIGEGTLIGANVAVVPYKKIGGHCLIGAGSVVTKTIPDKAIVRGNPGRIIKINELG